MLWYIIIIVKNSLQKRKGFIQFGVLLISVFAVVFLLQHFSPEIAKVVNNSSAINKATVLESVDLDSASSSSDETQPSSDETSTPTIDETSVTTDEASSPVTEEVSTETIDQSPSATSEEISTSTPEETSELISEEVSTSTVEDTSTTTLDQTSTTTDQTATSSDDVSTSTIDQTSTSTVDLVSTLIDQIIVTTLDQIFSSPNDETSTSTDQVSTSSDQTSSSVDSAATDVISTTTVVQNLPAPLDQISTSSDEIIPPPKIENPSLEIKSVSSPIISGTFRSGIIPIIVAFNMPVVVSGNPVLILSTGNPLTTAVPFKYGFGNQLYFLYHISPGNSAHFLDYNSSSALELNGGNISDISGHEADLNLPSPGSSGSLSDKSQIVIETSQ